MSTFTDKDRERMTQLWTNRKAIKTGSIGMKPSSTSSPGIKVKRPIPDDDGDVSNSDKRKKHPLPSNKMDGTGTLMSRSSKLAQSARSRLSYSHFRTVNEFLYSHSSEDSIQFMDGDSFAKYHEAYEELVGKWPVRPIDVIIDMTKKVFKDGKGKVFADVGCGNKPMMSNAFPKATVHSFDLVSQDEQITVASSDNLPLDDASCDLVIYSLSLMNIDVGAQLMEGVRILKPSGRMIIAEVSSRFQEPDGISVDNLVKKLHSSLGLKLVRKEELKPNGFFVLLHLKMSGTKGGHVSKPGVSLAPCLYKPR